MKCKICLMVLPILLILFVLVRQVQVVKENYKEEIQELITQQTETCKLLKNKNKKISLFLDKTLNSLDQKQEPYQEIKKIRATTEGMQGLILKIEKRLEEALQEKNEELLLQNLSEINDDLVKVRLIHRFINNLLWVIFPPLFEKEIPSRNNYLIAKGGASPLLPVSGWHFLL